MTIFKLSRFGATLTGREFGKTSYQELLKEPRELPVVLDFAGVASLGSSFADEIVPYFAEEQSRRITVLNVNDVVRSCLRDVRDETGIEIILGTDSGGGAIVEAGSL
jgi:hypothetical protein